MNYTSSQRSNPETINKADLNLYGRVQKSLKVCYNFTKNYSSAVF